MQDYHINVFYSQDNGGYIADIPDLSSAPPSARRPATPCRKSCAPKTPGWPPPTTRISRFPAPAIALPFIRPFNGSNSGPGSPELLVKTCGIMTICIVNTLSQCVAALRSWAGWR